VPEENLFVRFLKLADFAPKNLKDHRERRFHSEIVALLFSSSRSGPTANVVAALLVVALLRNLVDPVMLLAWLMVIISLAILRLRTIRFYTNRKSNPKHAPRSPLYWCLRLALWTSLMALCWGAMPIFLFPSAEPMYQLLQALILGGLAAAGVTTMSPLRGMVYLFVLSILVPLFFSFYLLPGELGQFLSIAVVFFVVFMLRTAEIFRSNLHFSIRLRLEKESLALNLERQKQELDLINQRLDLALQESQAAGRMKSEFLANMSHEIRTPLNGVIGMIELALGVARSAIQKNYLSLARDSADSLLAIINDILDLSKIEAGKIKLHREDFSLQKELSRAFSIFTIAVGEKNIDLTFKIDPEVPDCLYGDKVHLSQVITNLVGNAVKFTGEGGLVEVGVRLNRQDNDQFELKFEVTDNGIGIAPEHQEMIFDAFSQADYSVSRVFGGTGLGLAICSKLVRLMNGEIELKSKLGQGSTFAFTAQFKRGTPREDSKQELETTKTQSSGSITPQRRIRVLLAEDNIINQKVAGNLLKRHGFFVETAKNGERAIEMINNNQPYDLILMDCQMPILDGYAATKKLRSMGYDMPIIAITAHAMDGDRERCLEAGMDDYISKPIRKDELLGIIKKRIGR